MLVFESQYLQAKCRSAHEDAHQSTPAASADSSVKPFPPVTQPRSHCEAPPAPDSARMTIGTRYR